jgi:hypothetical protein
MRAVKSAPKRKRKIAGPKIAPLIAMPAVQPLSESEWQLLLQLLPSQPLSSPLRIKLDWLMWTYLGILQGEAGSPSAREVATVLETVARHAHQFAGYLYTLDSSLASEETGAFNTASGAAADILAKALIKPEGQSVLAAALRGNEILAAVAAQEAKKLAERSKKGRPIRSAATPWMLRQLAQFLRDNGLPISKPPKAGDSLCVSSQRFLRAALTRAEALREPEWTRKEIKDMLMLSEQVFAHRVRQALQAPEESLLPI